MEKEVRATLWVEDSAVRVESSLYDFQGNVQGWRNAFYDVWRHQMTWKFAYSIRVSERRETGVYLSMLVKKCRLANVKEMLDGLGYRGVTTWEENVGIVQTYDIDDPVVENMFEVFAE